MKTIILCGGRGYRLKEKTQWQPKPMITIGGKPILWHIMKIYQHHGFNEFVIALGYRGYYIKKFFETEKNNRDGFKISFADTGIETLPGERIARTGEYITEEDFMVTYGDGVSDIDIKKLVNFHKKQETLGTITVVHPRSSYGMIKTQKGNIVAEFVEKPLLPAFVNGGFMIFKKDTLKFFKKKEMEHAGLIRLTKARQLSSYRHTGFWHSMDTYRDMEHLNRMWKKGAPWKIWEK